MTSCSSCRGHRAGLAFDSIAEQYDDIFTRSLIGRAQRDVVWDVLQKTFRRGDRVLELNCGTGRRRSLPVEDGRFRCSPATRRSA